MFNLQQKMDRAKAKELNPVVLAFVGDAVYSLFVRKELCFNFDKKAGELNKLAVEKVKATAQAEFYNKIKDLLTEEEVELLTTPSELADQKEAIVKAMAKGTNRNIESESAKSKNKAAE